MKKEDINFRKSCQLYHNRVKSLLRKGKINEAQEIIANIQASLQAWEEHIKSARFRINILKSLFTQITIEKTSFIKRAERRQQDND